MYVVVDNLGRVVCRCSSLERARRVSRMAHNLKRQVLIHDTTEKRENPLFNVRVVITGRKERYFGEPMKANEWAQRHLKEKMTIGAHARFYKRDSSTPFSVFKLTERGVVVTKGANVGSVV